MILYKNVTGKKSYLSRKCMEQRMFTNMIKKGQLIQKHPWIYSICRCLEKKSFYKNVSDLTSFSQDIGLFFFRTLIPVFLFPETLLAAPIFFLEKKFQESKTQDFISSDILTSENWDFLPQFLFPGGFFRNLFSDFRLELRSQAQ